MMTYNYDTGKITRDFIFKKIDNLCRVDENKSTLIGVMCKTCPFYKGERMESFDKGFVLCGNIKGDDPFAEDDPGCSKIRSEMYERFRNDAICHYYD